MIALFDRYPSLAEKLPRVALCDLPTPVARLERLGASLDLPRLYVKRDDLTLPALGATGCVHSAGATFSETPRSGDGHIAHPIGANHVVELDPRGLSQEVG